MVAMTGRWASTMPSAERAENRRRHGVAEPCRQEASAILLLDDNFATIVRAGPRGPADL